MLKQKEYEDKYDVDIVRDAETGRTTVKDREKDELEVERDRKKHPER